VWSRNINYKKERKKVQRPANRKYDFDKQLTRFLLLNEVNENEKQINIALYFFKVYHKMG